MKYELEQKILYKGRSARVHDYSHRFKQYTVVIESPGEMNGYRVYDAEERDIEPFPVYVSAACTKCYLVHNKVLKEHENNFICPTCEGVKT